MHSAAAALALLLCAGQVSALPVNSPMSKGDTKVMRCVLEVISDSLSKPSPMPVSLDCLETLQGDERILSILRHQNLLKELQDLAFQGATERVQQQKQQHGDFEDELSEVLENQDPEAKAEEETAEAPSKDTVEKREDSEEAPQGGGVTEGARPQAFLEPKQDSPMVGHGEKDVTNTQPPASLPGREHPPPQAAGDIEEGLSAQQDQQPRQEEEEEGEAEEKAGPEEEEGPTAAPSSGRGFDSGLDYKEIQKGDSPSETQTVDGGGKMVAAEARPSKGKGQWEHSEQEEEEEEEEVMPGAPGDVLQGGKSQELQPQQQQEQQRLSREWEGAKRWGRMEQLAKELTAEKRPGEEDPDRSMKRPFRARPYGFREPGPQPRWGWSPPSSREDSVEAHSDPGEKKEEEGSANRRAEDQELESLSAIEAELEKVAHRLHALRRG
uniref:Chromogranin-A n=1 Tax=Jaculus jaculus TaxID=51337 RepID=A0A8C5KJ97_JACJA